MGAQFSFDEDFEEHKACPIYIDESFAEISQQPRPRHYLITARDTYRQKLDGAKARVDGIIAENKCARGDPTHFTVDGLVSSGGFGQVFKVTYKESGNLYALKIQAKSPKGKPRPEIEVEHMIEEKKMQSAFLFPFILSAHFAFQDETNLYLMMTYAPYGDLSRLRYRGSDEKMAKYMIAQVIMGVEYLHACRIIHADLKPNNVLICHDSYLKITDFGLAQRIPDIIDTTFYQYSGTPAYLSPEMTKGAGYTKTIDWWGVGMILYIMVYQCHAFLYPNYNERQMLNAMLSDDKKPYFPPGVDPNSPMNRLICGLLTKLPGKRLGGRGFGGEDVKQQSWFHDINFFDIYDKRVPFKTTLEPKKVKALEGPLEFGKLIEGKEAGVWEEF